MAQLVGGAVGAVVGLVVGGPAGAAWGWAIGSAAGGVLFQPTVRQPRLGELAQARANEGGARARVYGTFRPVGGQVVWAGAAREIRQTQGGGKGGGPSVETSVVRRSYAVGICEGPITGVRRIWRNGVLVYDVREGSALLAESAQWLQSRTLLLGGWDQLPHPTIEAEAGAANAPAMRGTALLVVSDEDLTDTRGAVPAYQFEVFRGRRALTTQTYPLEAIEGLDVGAAMTGGLTLAPGIEGIDLGAAITGGELRSLLISYGNYPPEGVDVSAAITSGELRQILITYGNYPPEGVDVSAAITGGELRQILITYGNYPPEGVDVTAAITGGTLS